MNRFFLVLQRCDIAKEDLGMVSVGRSNQNWSWEDMVFLIADFCNCTVLFKEFDELVYRMKFLYCKSVWNIEIGFLRK